MSTALKASIITIGDELLIGQTVDTNSAWMGQELNKAGIWVQRRVAVGDNWEDIWQALDEEKKKSQLIFITGGLGPTADDITKPLLCAYFGGKLVIDQGALDNVTMIFEKILKRPMIERNLKQAEVPDVCTVIPNRRGTAPGMWFEKDDCIFVSMPGVPHEMKGMMTDSVIPALSNRFRLVPVQHRTLLTAGIGESFLAERIQDFESSLPEDIKLAYLPNYGMVKLRLTCTTADPARGKELDRQFNQLKGQVADVMVVDEDIALAEALGRRLSTRKQTICTAESCTGGYIAHLITAVPGSSAYYPGSVVAYANAVKNNLLHVSQTTLESEGAVSEATVTEMVKGALAQFDTDYALAVSGIMGPDGGSAEKPVGLVWIAVGNKAKILTQQYRFRFDRQRNIELTANNALNLMLKFIVENT